MQSILQPENLAKIVLESPSDVQADSSVKIPNLDEILKSHQPVAEINAYLGDLPEILADLSDAGQLADLNNVGQLVDPDIRADVSNVGKLVDSELANVLPADVVAPTDLAVVANLVDIASELIADELDAPDIPKFNPPLPDLPRLDPPAMLANPIFELPSDTDMKLAVLPSDAPLNPSDESALANIEWIQPAILGDPVFEPRQTNDLRIAQPVIGQAYRLIPENRESGSVLVELIPGVVTQTSVAKTGVAQISVAQISAAQISEAQISAPQTSVAQTSEAQTSEAQTSEAQTSEAQTSEAQTSEARTSEARTSEARTSQANLGEMRWTLFDPENPLFNLEQMLAERESKQPGELLDGEIAKDVIAKFPWDKLIAKLRQLPGLRKVLNGLKSCFTVE